MGDENGKMNPIELRNAQALAENLNALRTEYGERFRYLENAVASLTKLVQGMQQTIGVALHEVRGSGATEGDRGTLD